ncbi:hypothetical protein Hdeb2414_s0007g00234221 [Helianthus debilis subsp. tardiflorus]
MVIIILSHLFLNAGKLGTRTRMLRRRSKVLSWSELSKFCARYIMIGLGGFSDMGCHIDGYELMISTLIVNHDETDIEFRGLHGPVQPFSMKILGRTVNYGFGKNKPNHPNWVGWSDGPFTGLVVKRFGFCSLNPFFVFLNDKDDL